MTDAPSSNPSVHVRRLCSMADSLDARGGGWQAEVDNLRMAAAEIERLTAERDAAEERSKACDQIAEGDEGWRVLRNLCVSTMSVAKLRDAMDSLPIVPWNGGWAIKPTAAAADAFWKYWRENGEPHVHGYYESTWGAINQALRGADTSGESR